MSLGFIVMVTPWTIQEVVAACTGSKVFPVFLLSLSLSPSSATQKRVLITPFIIGQLLFITLIHFFLLFPASLGSSDIGLFRHLDGDEQ